MRFARQHPLLGPARAFAFLAPDALDFIAARGDIASLFFLNLVEQQAPGQEAVESLLPRGLAFHLQAGGTMQQHHARGSLVDVLAAVAAGADKRFLNVRFAHAEGGHASRQLRCLFQADGKAHWGLLAVSFNSENSTASGGLEVLMASTPTLIFCGNSTVMEVAPVHSTPSLLKAALS